MRTMLIAGTSLALAACAAPIQSNDYAMAGEGATSQRRCFQPSTARSFRADDERVVYVRSGSSSVFELGIVGTCQGLESAVGISISERYAASRSVCEGDPVELSIVGGPTALNGGRCSARVNRSLSADEIAALPDRVRP